MVCASQCQMLTGINTKDIVSPENIERDYLFSQDHETLRRIGEVILILGIAGTDLVEGIPEFR